MPATIVFGSTHLLLPSTTNPGDDSIASYRILSPNETYEPYSGGTINVPLLKVISHDTTSNKLVGTFEFSGKNGSNIKQFTEGAFSVTYTE